MERLRRTHIARHDRRGNDVRDSGPTASERVLADRGFVTRLRTDPTGRSVAAVDVEHPSGPMQLSADIIVVSAGAVNSAALLLRSADEKHPNGLANSSDQVGRNY